MLGFAFIKSHVFEVLVCWCTYSCKHERARTRAHTHTPFVFVIFFVTIGVKQYKQFAQPSGTLNPETPLKLNTRWWDRSANEGQPDVTPAGAHMTEERPNFCFYPPACMRAHPPTCIRIYTYARVQNHPIINIYTHMHACTPTALHLYTHIHTCTPTHI